MLNNKVFSDYTMKMTVEAPVYFSIVVSLKANESNQTGNCKIFYCYASIKYFLLDHSHRLNWKRYSSLKTNNFEKPRLIP